jgi:hypothetical protein
VRTESNIDKFVRHELDEVAETNHLGTWPSEEDIQKLVRKAGRLFIYAATACRYLRKSAFPDEHLPKMFAAKITGHSSTAALAGIYLQVIQQPLIRCPVEDRDHLVRLFKWIVGSVIIMSETLSSSSLVTLLNVPMTQLRNTLKPLHSVLDIPDDNASPIQTLPLSFHDFLIDKTRCTDDQVWVNEKNMHNDLLRRCLEIMSGHLRRNICDLQQPGVIASEVEKSKVESSLPPAVRYACLYWVTHFQESEISLSDCERVHAFLSINFLHWLESLSLLGKFPEGILSIRKLQGIVQVCLTTMIASTILSPDGRFLILGDS